MSKILRRPMFRGGSVSSYGNGIASGLADGGRVNYAGGGQIGGGTIYGTPMADGRYGFKKSVYKSQRKIPFIPESKTLMPQDLGAPTGTKTQSYLQGVGGPMFTGADIMNFIQDNPKFGGTDFTGALQGKWNPETKRWEAPSAKAAQYALEQMNDPELQKVMRNMMDPDFALLDPDKTPEENASVVETDEDRANIMEMYRSGQSDAAMESQQQLKEILENQRIKNKSYEKDILDQRKQTVDQPIVGVTEEVKEEVKESFEDDGTEMGFQKIADQYYDALTSGSQERLDARKAIEEQKGKDKISRARKTDAFNTMLKFFEGSQQEGATVGSSAAEASKYLTSKPSATELAMDKRDTREEALSDRDFLREEGRRDTAAQMAFKEMTSKDAAYLAYKRQSALLDKRLDAAVDLEDKKAIRQEQRILDDRAFQRELKQLVIDSKDDRTALERNIKYIAKKFNVDEDKAFKLYKGDPAHFQAQLDATIGKTGYINEESFRAAARTFYGNDFIEDLTLTEIPNVGDPAEGQKNGYYTDSVKQIVIKITDGIVEDVRSYN